MMRTITVTQPVLFNSSLSLIEEGRPAGTFSFTGLRKRRAQLNQAHRQLTFRTLGLLGRTVRADAADGSTVAEFHRSGLRARGVAVIQGRHYRLKVSGVLARRFCWVDADGTEAMCLKLGGLLRTSGTIEITDSAFPDDAAALIGLGLVAHRASESDSGAAGAGVAG